MLIIYIITETVFDTLKRNYKNLTLSKLSCTSNTRYTDSSGTDNEIVLGRRYNLEAEESVENYHAVFLGPNGRTLSNLAMGIPAKSWQYFDDNEMRNFTASNSVWLKRRRYLVEKLKDAKVVGIVVATLGIKNYLESIKSVKNALKLKNKKSYIVCVGKPNPAKLANFPEVK